MINMSTKFEALMFTHNEDTKTNAKCRNLDGLGWLRVTQGHQQPNYSIEHTQFPIRL